MDYDIFISYSRKDTEIVNAIEMELTSRGVSCFVDKSGINLGDDFAEIISKAIFECKIMLFVWSENSNQSENTANEIALAIDFGKTIIPFKIGQFQSHYKLAYRLVRFNRIDTLTFNRDNVSELAEKIGQQLGLNPQPVLRTDSPPVAATQCVLKIRPNLDCAVFVDDERCAEALAGKITKISLNKGTFYLEFVSAENAVDKVIFENYILDSPEQLLPVDLESVVNQRLKIEELSDSQILVEFKLLKNKKLYSEAYQIIEPLARKGNAEAQYSLGNMYYYGNGVTKDYTETAKWYHKSAEQGNEWAQYHLGEMYYYGRGVTKDYTEAIKWFRKSAEQGNEWAQNYLGVMYEYGRGVTKDYAEAVKWHQKSAEHGNDSSKRALKLLGIT